MATQRNNSFWFWICLAGAVIDNLLFWITVNIPHLREQAEVFLLASVFFAVGAVANYLNCLSEDKGS